MVDNDDSAAIFCLILLRDVKEVLLPILALDILDIFLFCGSPAREGNK